MRFSTHCLRLDLTQFHIMTRVSQIQKNEEILRLETGQKNK